jgi:hypothetical protein
MERLPPSPSAGRWSVDPGHRRRQITAPSGLGRRVGEVAEKGEVEVRLPVGQVLHLEMLHRLGHRFHAAEQRGHDDERAEIRRHAAVAGQVELGEQVRREQPGDQPVHHVHRDVVARDQCEEEHHRPGRPGGGPAQPEQRQQRGDGPGEHPADEDDVGVAQRPAVEPEPRGGSVAGVALQRGEPLVHQEEAHMPPAVVGRLAAQPHRLARDFGLVPAGPLGDALHHVAVPVPGGEGHPMVDPQGVSPELRLHGALRLDERLPVQPGDGPEAGDAVRHGDLGERHSLGGAARGVLRVHPVLGDPVLQGSERRRAVAGAELLEKAGDEGGRELGGAGDEQVERRLERAVFRGRGGAQPGGPAVRRLQLLQPPDRPEGHPPHALDEAQPQHRGERPELADPEWRDLLERPDEAVQILELDPGLGMGDQGDDDLVDPGEAGQPPAGQLRQLAVVTPGQALPHLQDVLLNHVQVVEQPFAGGP